jgi:hypothetical protein
MFSLTELFVLFAVGASFGLIALRILRPSRQRAFASAPPAAFRTPTQMRLHWASLACLLPPFGYISGFDGTHFFPVFATLFALAATMQLLQIVGLGYVARLWLIPCASVLSVVAGAGTSIWPNLNIASLSQVPWFLLVATSALASLSTALSIVSFPIGFGERAK